MPIKLFKAPGIVILFLCFASCHQKNQEMPSIADTSKDSIQADTTAPEFMIGFRNTCNPFGRYCFDHLSIGRSFKIRIHYIRGDMLKKEMPSPLSKILNF